MAKTLNLDFNGWVKYLFDHPVSDGIAWYHKNDYEYWGGEKKPEFAVPYMTRLFENMETLVAPYTDAQLNQSLWFLCSNANSNYMFTLLAEAYPVDERVRCVKAMYTVFEKLFALRCTPHLGHQTYGGKPEMSPLNSICYMWWDIMPIYGMPDVPQRKPIDQAMLDVMARVLAIPHIACQEAALHGLGHWSIYYQNEVEAIIDKARKNGVIHKWLHPYADAARDGHVM